MHYELVSDYKFVNIMTNVVYWLSRNSLSLSLWITLCCKTVSIDSKSNLKVYLSELECCLNTKTIYNYISLTVHICMSLSIRNNITNREWIRMIDWCHDVSLFKNSKLFARFFKFFHRLVWKSLFKRLIMIYFNTIRKLNQKNRSKTKKPESQFV